MAALGLCCPRAISICGEQREGEGQVTLSFLCESVSSWWLLLLQSRGFGALRLLSLWCTGLVAPKHMESSQTWDRTNVPCTPRCILNQWNPSTKLLKHKIFELWLSPQEVIAVLTTGYVFHRLLFQHKKMIYLKGTWVDCLTFSIFESSVFLPRKQYVWLKFIIIHLLIQI